MIVLISHKIENQINFTTITLKKLFVYVDVKMISVQKSQFKQQGICLRASMSQFQKKGVVANTFAYYDTHKRVILKFQYNFIFQCVAAH